MVLGMQGYLLTFLLLLVSWTPRLVSTGPFQPLTATSNKMYFSQSDLPVLHFLWLTWGPVYNKEIWRIFFQDVPADRYRVIICAKNITRLSLDPPQGFPYKVTTYETAYHNKTGAMHHLLDMALQSIESESVLSHGDVRGSAFDKFIFVSDDTLPLEPFYVMYHRLISHHTNSLLTLTPTREWISLGHDVYIPKHHQWMILNKTDAMLSLWQFKKYGGSLAKLVETLDTSGNVLSEKQRHLLYVECQEEYWFGPALYGLKNATNTATFPLIFPSEVEQGFCPMWVWWPYKPNSPFRKHGIPELTEANTRGSQHLWTVPLDFIKALRHSPFFFGRKWNHIEGSDKLCKPDQNMTLTEAFANFVLV